MATTSQPTSSVEPEAFKPHPAQALFLLSRAPELLFSSAYGKGKSRVLCEKANRMCWAWPGYKAVIARRYRAHLGSTTIQTFREEVAEPGLVDQGWKQAADGGTTLHYPNGSSILFAGLDQPETLRSGSFSGAYIEQAEELNEEQWQAIGGRLRNDAGPYRQLAAVCNPESPAHFLFRRFRPDLGTRQLFTEREERLPDGSILPPGQLRAECILSGETDNYENLPRDYLVRLARLTGRYRERYVLGRWVAYEGLVYGCFDPDLHVIDRPREWLERWGGYPPPTWPRYMGIDFGYVNPFVALWLARSPNGTLYLYRELYYSHRLVKDHGAQIKALRAEEASVLERCARDQGLEPRRPSYELIASDHDAEDRATLDDLGIPSDPAIKDISPGIQTVYNMLSPFEDEHGLRRARIYFVRDALVEPDPWLVSENMPTSVIDELPAYRFPRQRPGESMTRNPKENPADGFDHGCDALRYCLHTLSVVGDIRVVRLFKPGEFLARPE